MHTGRACQWLRNAAAAEGSGFVCALDARSPLLYVHTEERDNTLYSSFLSTRAVLLAFMHTSQKEEEEEEEEEEDEATKY